MLPPSTEALLPVDEAHTGDEVEIDTQVGEVIVTFLLAGNDLQPLLLVTVTPRIINPDLSAVYTILLLLLPLVIVPLEIVQV